MRNVKEEIAAKFPALTKSVIAHSEDIKLVERMQKIIDKVEDKNKRFSLNYYLTRPIVDPDMAPFGKQPEERTDCLAYHFGSMLMNGSFYEEDHKDYVEYNSLIQQIQKEFADVESIKSLCDTFLEEGRKYFYTFFKIRQLTHSFEGDWTR